MHWSELPAGPPIAMYATKAVRDAALAAPTPPSRWFPSWLTPYYLIDTNRFVDPRRP